MVNVYKDLFRVRPVTEVSVYTNQVHFSPSSEFLDCQYRNNHDGISFITTQNGIMYCKICFN